MSFIWSQEAIGLLHRFYVQEGLSAAQTAEALANALEGGPTRNAVLGKAQRLGLCKPAAPEPCEVAVPARSRPLRRGPFRRPKPPPEMALPPLREAPAASSPKLWTERRWGECAYPLGEADGPGRQLCCCAPTGGAVYCPPHRELMVLPKSALTAEDQAAILAVARRAA